ncbi:metal-dependent hydrolase [Candidatus Saccharibacteria bacterium]|nr:metal-dependent hydrolase [Candidatus Saccharibacteria bacterium]
MANYKGHVVGGLLAGTVVSAGYYLLPGRGMPNSAVLVGDWQLLVAVYVVAVLFGLWPDVDTNSKAQDIFFGIAFAADVLLIAFGYFAAAAILGLLAMTPIVGTHRGWTHSRLAMIIVPLPIVIVSYLASSQVGETSLLIYGAAVAGYFSHLLFDGLIIKSFRIKGAWK